MFSMNLQMNSEPPKITGIMCIVDPRTPVDIRVCGFIRKIRLPRMRRNYTKPISLGITDKLIFKILIKDND